MKNKSNISLFIALILIAFGAIYRVIPHFPNFAPITGIALLSGAVIANKRLAYLVPVLALYISDFVINNTILRASFADHSGLVLFSNYMIWVYAGFILITFLGIRFLKNVNIAKLTGCAISGSVFFFLITNFGVWLRSPLYPNNFAGLIESYIAGIPFFRTSLLADLIFTFVFFGVFYGVQKFAFARFNMQDSQI